MRIRVRHLSGSTLAGTFQEFDSPRVILGRSSSTDVRFDPRADTQVSGRHAELYVEGGRLHVRDLGSTNGVFVNEVRVSGPHALTAGDRIHLGVAGPLLVAEALHAAVDPEITLPKVEVQAAAVAAAPAVAAAAAAAPAARAPFAGGSRAPSATAPAASPPRPVVVRRGAPFWLVLLLVAAVGGGGYWLWTQIPRIPEVSAAELYDPTRLRTTLTNLLEPEEAIQAVALEARMRDLAMEQVRVRADADLSEADRQARMDELRAENDTLIEEALGLYKRAMAAAELDWSETIARYEHSVFLVLCLARDSSGRVLHAGTGTGWCVRSDGLIATNGHVAAMADPAQWNSPESLVARNGVRVQRVSTYALQNEVGLSFELERFLIHPDYDGSATSPDVALMKFDSKGEEFLPFELATDEEVAALGVGDFIGTMGFPGEENYLESFDPDRVSPGVSAFFKDGVITRMTTFQKRIPKDPAEALYIGHSASTSGGTSGSPMLNVEGRVVVVHNSGLAIELAGGVKLGVSANLNAGIRVDVLRDLLEQWRD